jgi:ADP-heptose:LPS heptosyltransferase
MPDMRPHIERVKRLLKKNGMSAGNRHSMPGERFFVMVPHARWSTKLWGDEQFAELAKAAMARFNMGTVLIGGTMDRAALEDMRANIGAGAVNLAGETDLLELSALFSLADFVVTVDSGPMHIAAAANTPVIALFGPTTPKRTGPYASEGAGGAGGVRHTVITKGLDCSPCFKKKCPDPRCMTDIAVEDVIGAIERLMQYSGDACAR